MRFKDFDAAEAERKGEPITFRLGGREWPVVHLGAPAFLAFVRQSADRDDKGDPTPKSVWAFYDYILSTLPGDQHDAFEDMLTAENIRLETLASLTKWIVEQMSGNPTDVVSPSRPTRSKTG